MKCNSVKHTNECVELPHDSVRIQEVDKQVNMTL